MWGRRDGRALLEAPLRSIPAVYRLGCGLPLVAPKGLPLVGVGGADLGQAALPDAAIAASAALSGCTLLTRNTRDL